MKDIKENFPHSKIILLTTLFYTELMSYCPYIDGILVLNLRQFNEKNDRGKLKSWVEFYNYLKLFLEDIKQLNFDNVYNLSHSILSAFMLSYLRIPKVCGFIFNDKRFKRVAMDYLDKKTIKFYTSQKEFFKLKKELH